jgi:hypothetical protein
MLGPIRSPSRVGGTFHSVRHGPEPEPGTDAVGHLRALRPQLHRRNEGGPDRGSLQLQRLLPAGGQPARREQDQLSGQAIPVKFSLGGNQGLDIFQPGSPSSGSYACTATPEDVVEQTETGSTSGLTSEAGSGQYKYVWKTEKAWANTCRKLVLKLKDGTSHEALFHFTK